MRSSKCADKEESMIKAVFFDLDNTLYDFSSCHKKAWEKVLVYGEQVLSVSRDKMNQVMRDEMNRTILYLGLNNAAIHNRHIRYQKVLKTLGIPIFPHADQMYQTYWKEILAHVVPEPGAGELIQRLRDEGYYVAVATNMTAYMQYKKIEKLGFGNLLNEIISSEEAGFEKPYPKFFEFCAARAGVQPEECAFIGDSMKMDICGSYGAGMHPVLYRPPKERETNLPGSLMLDQADVLENEWNFSYEIITDFRDMESCLQKIKEDKRR